MRELRSRLTFANVCSFLALLIAVGTGSAYAANTVFSTDIVDGEVKSADIGNNQVFSADVRNDTLNGGGLTASDLRIGAVESNEVQDGSLTSADYKDDDIRSEDVKNLTLGNGDFLAGSVDSRVATNDSLNGFDIADNSLTGADIQDQSGVDTCVSTTRYGQLCARVENSARPFAEALRHCGNLDLHLPSLGEAVALVATRDLPDLGANEPFWTSDAYWFTFPDGSGARPEAWSVVDDASSTFSGGPWSASLETVCVTTPTN